MKKESKIVLAEKDVNDYVNKKINLEELAKRTGCSRFTAARKLRALDCKDVIDRINENRARGPAKLTIKQIERILQKARAGETAINISMEYNVDPATIRYHLKLNGIQAKRAKRCDWVEVKSKTLSIDYDFSSIIPNNIFSQVNKMMTRSMRITSTDICELHRQAIIPVVCPHCGTEHADFTHEAEFIGWNCVCVKCVLVDGVEI